MQHLVVELAGAVLFLGGMVCVLLYGVPPSPAVRHSLKTWFRFCFFVFLWKPLQNKYVMAHNNSGMVNGLGIEIFNQNFQFVEISSLWQRWCWKIDDTTLLLLLLNKIRVYLYYLLPVCPPVFRWHHTCAAASVNTPPGGGS